MHLLTQNRVLSAIRIWIYNSIFCFRLDVITRPWLNLTTQLVELPLELGYEWMIIFCCILSYYRRSLDTYYRSNCWAVCATVQLVTMDLWRTGNGRVFSTLANAVGGKLCVLRCRGPGFETMPTSWSNSLISGIQPLANVASMQNDIHAMIALLVPMLLTLKDFNKKFLADCYVMIGWC